MNCPDARDGGGCKAEEENRRVDDHPRVLQQRIESATIRWDRAIAELEWRLQDQQSKQVQLDQTKDWPDACCHLAAFACKNPA